MDNTFADSEKLYRAVYPESYIKMFWRKDGSVSSAAFKDEDGLSVERGNYREDCTVIEDMQKYFNGCIVSLTVEQCKNVNAVIRYKPTKRSIYHSEIHGNEEKAVLSPSQRKKLASMAKIEYYEE
ncbi:MAG: hypothetical protein MR380_01915 [Lachnospiraceae bacterium]|nr:hypothetical protein [Lachnospiraceae bacterium]